ncbi:A24 family peptidase [Hirschia litorea]|uniref:Prepilin peptidase n=1 Tax=Hirschia litorea TaxID=1199156 RepID=A0ABW2IJL8_9PROT
MIIIILAGVFAGLLVYGAIYDVLERIIPNWVSIVIALAFLPAAYFAHLTLHQFGWHLLVGFIAFIAGVVLFYLKAWGGGDAKLVAATSLWMGVSGGMTFLAAFAIAGGIVAIPLIIVRRLKIEPKNERLAKIFDVKKVPYGVAIAAGGFWAAPKSLILINALNAISVAN